MESYLKHQKRFICNACNKVYSKKYMTQHHITLKHFENVSELQLEMNEENYLTLGLDDE